MTGNTVRSLQQIFLRKFETPQMKRAYGKPAKDKEEFDDIPPTQRVPSEEEMDGGEGYPEDGEGDGPSGEIGDQTLQWPEQPDLGWYLSHWDISPKGQIAICRTFANYLSAQLPKTVEAKPARFSGKKLKK